MLLGIDVGGTFTDTVLIEEEKVIKYAKCSTTYPNILEGLLESLDKVLENSDIKKIKKVNISSTIVTNSLKKGSNENIFLIVMPGTGASVKGRFPVKEHVAKGYINHRGEVIKSPLVETHIINELLSREKIGVVSGKFSVRNPENEEKISLQLKKNGAKKVFLGSEISSELNFIRRTNTACFSAMVYKEFKKFLDSIILALVQKGINADIEILKADGGTLPIENILNKPVETIFTGPAASVLGIEALMPSSENAISIDVGGTTTDIAFWKNGRAIIARKGLKIEKYYTSVHGIFMKSVAIGGDSLLSIKNGEFLVGPIRKDVAMALGGKYPTLSDVMIVLGLMEFGDKQKAKNAIRSLSKDENSIEITARKFLDVAVDKLKKVIEDMIEELSLEAVYEVGDIFKTKRFVPKLLIGVGGAAKGITYALGDKFKVKTKVPKGAIVANAIGAAVAKTTISATIRVDTSQGFYNILEGEIHQKCSKSFDVINAKTVLSNFIIEQAKKVNINEPVLETIFCEEFFTIHNYLSSGKIINLKMQVKPGIARNIVFDKGDLL